MIGSVVGSLLQALYHARGHWRACALQRDGSGGGKTGRKHEQTTRIPRVDRGDVALHHPSFFDALLVAGLKYPPGNTMSACEVE